MEEDITTIKYYEKNDRFADFFNGFLFGGQMVIKPHMLKEQDSRGIVKGKAQEKSKYIIRDVIRKTYLGTSFYLFAIENQTDVHYAMPVKNLLYDAITYHEQIRKIKRNHRKRRDLSREEYLSGFSKTDKLEPVITAVIYYGKKPWDGSVDLMGMLPEGIPEEIKSHINNYKINLFDVRHSAVESFHTDIKQCFQFLRVEEDKEALRQLLANDKAYEALDEDTFDMISVLSGEKKLLPRKYQYENEGGYNMCKAFADMKQEGRQEAISSIKQLYFCILQDGRMEEFTKAMENTEYLQELYSEYGIG